jgi:hypothetical protein
MPRHPEPLSPERLSKAPSRRLNPWIALSVGIALTAMAIGGPRIYTAVIRLINPPPPNIIIIAPTGSDVV